MKKLKGLLATLLVLTILLGNMGWIGSNDIKVSDSNGGGFTTLSEPLPKRG